MGGRDDLVKALEAIMKNVRSAPGEAPTADELLAYRDGELGAADRARVAAKLEAFPEAALALENLAEFPHVRPGAGVTAPSAADTDAAWEAFRQRMGYGGDGGRSAADDATAGSAEGEPEAGETTSDGVGGSWWAQRSMAWAAAVVLLVVGAAVGWMLGHRAPQPTANLVVAQLVPLGGEPRRALEGAKVVEVPEEAEGLVLMLLGADEAAAEEYDVTVEDAAGGPVWSSRGSRADETGTLWVHLPREYVAPGAYRVVVRGSEEPAGADPTQYLFQVRTDAAP